MGKLPKADKSLGQHFLTDKKVITGITTDFESDCEAIVEVGPGPAILSKELSSKDLPYFFIEKDERFRDLLTPLTQEEYGHFGDALEFDWGEFQTKFELFGKKIWLVSNLPYNVGVPLLISFLKVPSIQYMSLMFQKEVGQKIVTTPQLQEMSSLKALCQNYFETKILLKVPPGAFSPPPKVDSIVISLVRKEKPVVSLNDFQYFESLLRAIFQFKRKQLGSVLKKSFSAKIIEENIDEDKIALTRRAETLTMEEVYYLFNQLRHHLT